MTQKKKNNIVIAAPIYPPEIGGPAQYAEMLVSGFKDRDDVVSVVTYGMLRKLPTGVRHIAYFFRLLPAVISSQYVIVLDTFSAALPAVVAAKLCRKKVVIRVGGDFLWEEYVDRTKEPLFLSEFYVRENAREKYYTQKEKILFTCTNFVLKNADKIVFSTKWQRDIMSAPYCIDLIKTAIIENVYIHRKKRNVVPKQRVILSPSRDRFLKNKANLQKAFTVAHERFTDISMDTTVSDYPHLLQRIQDAYCLIVPSFSEVSPNIVLDAISLGVPVIATIDCGIYDRLKDCVVWIDPRDPRAIADSIERLLDAQMYTEYMNRIAAFSFVHSERDIVSEFTAVFETL